MAVARRGIINFMYSPQRDTAAKWIVVALLVVILAAGMWYVAGLKDTTVVQLGDTVIHARVAKTDAAQVKGLSGTTHLRDDQGMLFVFDASDDWSVWMKDMKYSIDVIWLDANKRVVDIEHNIPPDTYPEKFSPDAASRYIIEVKSGFAERYHVYIGSKVTFTE